jgi:DNA-binding transcriptional ArsR family regulator
MRIFSYMNTSVFTALGEPSRFRIVELLRRGPRSVNEIVGRLDLRQSQVSQHLKVLREAGLVAAEPLAQQRQYRLRTQSLKELDRWLNRYRSLWEAKFEQLEDLVEELKQAQRRKPPETTSELL